MLDQIRSLPVEDEDRFFADPRNIWTTESCLRRGLEALLDLGRHILARGFGSGVSEYKEIADQLGKEGVLTKDEARTLRTLAGYRNRMVHFYHDVTPEELRAIAATQLGDLEEVADGYRRWIGEHTDRLDGTF